jgi:tryptophanyl-tRNA synthetase
VTEEDEMQTDQMAQEMIPTSAPPRVFSGARPTGRQHIGNYLGAIQNYVALQDEAECFFCIVDYHALTTFERTEKIAQNSRDMVLDWLAAGIDPARSVVFAQSDVPEITELHMLLSMIVPLSWLMRAPAFKEQSEEHPDNVNYGLLGYPVLMTGDILLYKASTVPVGEDQLPHLELAREIARRFNNRFGETFPVPQARLTNFPRVMGIDGTRKMSKSLDNHIELADTPEDLRTRVLSMVTDPQRRYRTDPGRPEVCNVYTLHTYYSPPDEQAEVYHRCTNALQGCVECKEWLSRNLDRALAPFRERRAAFAADPEHVEQILGDGAARARAVATETLREVRERVGLRPTPR